MFEMGHTYNKKNIEYYVNTHGCWIEVNHKINQNDRPTMGNGRGGPEAIAHYMYEKVNGKVPEHFRLYNKCKNKRCINPDHYSAVEKGKTIMTDEIKIWPGGKGEYNINWNGGVADYPAHSKMKRNRLEKLKQTKGKCEICGEKATKIHHIDGSKDNHLLDNLIAMCDQCHWTIHTGDQTNKYVKEYGMNLSAMVKRYGGEVKTYRQLHKLGRLHGYLEDRKAFEINKIKNLFIEDQEKEKVGVK